MFTGIVTDLGQVRHVEKRGDTHIVIGTTYDVGGIDMGASICCSGVCMTVVDKGGGTEVLFTSLTPAGGAAAAAAAPGISGASLVVHS